MWGWHIISRIVTLKELVLALTSASLFSIVRSPMKWMIPGALLEMAPPLDTSTESSVCEEHPRKEASP